MSDTKTADKAPEIKAEIRDGASKLTITVDPKTGVATQEQAFVLPEDVTVEQYKLSLIHI